MPGAVPYDPREAEWGPGHSIAETIIPWAVSWLACYEGWRATGEWTGEDDTRAQRKSSMDTEEKPPPKRSEGTLQRRRVPRPWPQDRHFRILSIDGGGIRGIYPAAFLAGLEQRYLGGASVARHFDLIAGTSTGGIIALGLAAGLTGADLADLYQRRGREIFPPAVPGWRGAFGRRFADILQLFKYRYDREALNAILKQTLGDRKFGQAQNRLCIPSFDGRYGEVYSSRRRTTRISARTLTSR